MHSETLQKLPALKRGRQPKRATIIAGRAGNVKENLTEGNPLPIDSPIKNLYAIPDGCGKGGLNGNGK
ncbi:MAG: hypothetical protein IT210_06990 [Armatimonadetes bacterium]|nr:hypothetical protein [Armatimonadota bacterium]